MSNKKLLSILIFFAVCLISEINAGFVDAFQAKNMIQGWLKLESQPLGARMSEDIESTDAYYGNDGEILFYVINLSPQGFIVAPAEDYIEPVISFSSTGKFVPDPKNPLYDFLTLDIARRTEFVKAKEKLAFDSNTKFAPTSKMVSAKSRWKRFIKIAQSDDIEKGAINSVSDPRVPALVQSTWDQSTAGGGNC